MAISSAQNRLILISGGEGGIRTHGTRKGSTVFETAAFDHSATSPHEEIPGRWELFVRSHNINPRLGKETASTLRRDGTEHDSAAGAGRRAQVGGLPAPGLMGQ